MKPTKNWNKKDNVAIGDGETHINIWIMGKTQLGIALSQFAFAPFKHPYFGPFNCVEGAWQWLRTREKDDELRSLIGQRAKSYGKNLTKNAFTNYPKDIVNSLNFAKIEQNSKIKKMLLESDLPFDHYYLHGPGKILIRPEFHQQIITGFEEIRVMMRDGCTMDKETGNILSKDGNVFMVFDYDKYVK